MAKEFDTLSTTRVLTGQIRLTETLPANACIRLRTKSSGQFLSDKGIEIGPNGFFIVSYKPPPPGEEVVVEVVNPTGKPLGSAIPLPKDGPKESLIITPDGARYLSPGEGYDFPSTLPHSEVYGSTGYPLSVEQLTLSQDGLENLRAAFDSKPREIGVEETPDYPWRLQVNSTTGLPTLVRAQLSNHMPATGEVDAVQAVMAQKDFSQAIFGVDMSNRFDQTFSAQPTIRLESGTGGRGLEQNSHLSWRQTYRGPDGNYLPVLGGGFRVHGRTNATEIAITNSYFPVSEADIDLNGKMEDEEILSRALAAFLAVPDIRDKAPLIAQLWARLHQTRGPQALLNRLGSLIPSWLRLAQPRQSAAQVTRENYYLPKGEGEDSYSLAIIPFAGHYHLTARVRLTVEGQDAWYVDIDAHSGIMVGRPWQRVSHARFYATSQNAADGPPPQADFPANPFGFPAEPSPPLFELPAAGGGTDEERSTIAVHGQRLYNYLRDSCGASQQLDVHVQAGRRIKIVLNASVRTQFNYDRSLSSKEILFEQSSEAGIQLQPGNTAPLIFFPARDPEIILHEMTHALFWLINPDPWEEQDVVSPFGRALHEGYAIYLARSVAAGSDPAENDKPWARGSYRADWGERWRLYRSSREVGADFLRMPNQYPAHSFARGFQNISLEDYDVGMIWARALWDLRQVLDPVDTDFLAVQAYPYLHGSIVNFETAAEGLMEADARGKQLNAAAAVDPIFSTRGLVSSEGVFGFAQTSTGSMAAATDRGIQLQTAGGWIVDATPGSSAITGVASLAVDGERLYAVAVPPRSAQMNSVPKWRTGLYKRENNQWLSMAAPGDTLLGVYALPTPSGTQLFLTTTGGVYRTSGTAPERLGEANSGLPVHDLVIWDQPGALPQMLVAARSDSVVATRVDQLTPATSVKWTIVHVGKGLRVSTLAVRRNPLAAAGSQEELYAGTLDGGIWKFDAKSFQATKLTTRPDAAVLALKSSGGRLVWSTAEEVGWSDDGQIRHHLELPCPAALVVSLLPQADGTLYAGTFAHGIWRVNLNAVTPVWQADRLPASQATQRIPAGRQQMVSYFHAQANPEARLLVRGGVTVARVAQPGFPLTVRQPNANQRYAITPGWVILLVKNPTATGLQVVAEGNGNGDIVITATG